MTHILVTNDDGVMAPSLLALVKEMRKFGKVTVLAPDRNWSTSGHVKTLTRPLRVKQVKLADGSAAIASDGAPSDCVALAFLGYISEEIDLVVSGINTAANLGSDVTYSGTVAAAFEGLIFGKPAIAFSFDGLNSPKNPDYTPAAKMSGQIVEQVVENGLPDGVLLNVNFPALPEDEISGFQVTRQGRRIYRDLLDSRVDPLGRDYYWIGGDIPTGDPDPGTDIGAVRAGYVSITPIHLDLTAHQHLQELSQRRLDKLVN